jgi:hypothetical protein
VTTRINNYANRSDVTSLEFFRRRANSRHAANNFVTGDQRINGLAPLVARHVQIGVTDAAIENLDRNFRGAGLASGESKWSKRRLIVGRGITF